jgi:PAS domain S-box-containing protein
VFDEHGAFKGYRGIARDVSEQRLAEQALRESDQRFKMFMDYSPAVAWIKDGALRYTYLSGPFEKMVGKGPAELLGRDDFEVGWPTGTELQQSRDHDLAVQRSGAPVQAIDRGVDPDGVVHHWLNVKFPLPDANGAVGVAGVALDISERVRAEEQVSQYSEQIRALFARLVTTQELERKRLAADLHDLIGQNLTALGIGLTNVSNAIENGGSASVKAPLVAMRRTVQQTIRAVRGVMTELRPPALDKYGLFPALQAHVKNFQSQTSLRTLTDFPNERPRLPAPIELTLFRIVQEALTNAAKHSGGTLVRVAIEQTGARVRLTVEDDGQGISNAGGTRKTHHGGWGLLGIRERAEAHGGVMRIEHPRRGFRLIVDIPVLGQ